MARIPQYQLDTEITGVEGLLGNDPGQGTAATKRFNIDDLKTFILEGIAGGSETSADYVSATSADGLSLQQTSIKVIRETSIDHTVNPLGLNLGYKASITIDGNGQVAILLENPRFEWNFSSFVGARFNAYEATSSEDASSAPIYSGTITSAEQFYYDNSGDTIFPLYVSLDSGQNLTTTVPLGINFVTGNQLELFGSFDRIKLSVQSGIDVDGDVSLGGLVNIGNAETQNAEVHIHGDIHFDEAGDRIIFGDNQSPDVVFVSDGDNLNIGGGGAINISSTNSLNVNSTSEFRGDITLSTDTNTNSTITISDSTQANTTVIGPTGVSINGVSIQDAVTSGFNPNQGTGSQVLTSVTFGDTIYSIPSPTGSAGVLPGVTVELGDAESVFTAAFFTGTVDVDPNSGEVAVTYVAAVPLTGSYSTVADSNTIESISSADAVVLDTQFSSNPLFFYDASQTTPSGVVTVDVYQVTEVNTQASSESITFGLVGGGGFTVSTDTTTINSGRVFLPSVPAREPGENRFAFIDSNTGALSYGDLQTTVGFEQLTYEVAGGAATMGIESLEYVGSHNINTNDANNPIIDLTGRFAFGGELDDSTSDIQLESWRLYVLNPITADKRLELPLTPAVGDSIKIVNLSTVSTTITSGTAGNVSSFEWSLGADGTGANQDRIMRQETDLELDDQTASFELYFTGGTAGWVITSIN